jgi:hypothetical protein
VKKLLPPHGLGNIHSLQIIELLLRNKHLAIAFIKDKDTKDSKDTKDKEKT